jgi:hypothetical protein
VVIVHAALRSAYWVGIQCAVFPVRVAGAALYAGSLASILGLSAASHHGRFDDAKPAGKITEWMLGVAGFVFDVSTVMLQDPQDFLGEAKRLVLKQPYHENDCASEEMLAGCCCERD